MPWTINSEIYPLWARSTGNACAAGVNWTFNILVSLTFLHLAQYLTYYGQYFYVVGVHHFHFIKQDLLDLLSQNRYKNWYHARLFVVSRQTDRGCPLVKVENQSIKGDDWDFLGKWSI